MANPSSVKPRQQQEGDIANQGGTAPGGTVGFMSAKGDPSRIDPIAAANVMHQSAADGAPDGSGNVPIHPGLAPGLFKSQTAIQNDPTANGQAVKAGPRPVVISGG